MQIKNIFFVLVLTVSSLVQGQQLETYEVKEGETLKNIARRFKVSAEQIIEYNPDLSRSGKLSKQNIFIPLDISSKTSYAEHAISEGETLWSISRSYGLTVQDIKKANPALDQNELKTGSRIKIPVSKLSKERSRTVNQSITNSRFKTLKHLVLPKETKYGIAKQYGIEVDQLEKANPSIKALQPGQILTIKRESKEKEQPIPDYVGYKYYKVPDDATIFSLTKEYDITEQELKNVNPALKNLGLQKGMVLKLPRKTSTDKVFSLFAEQPLDLKTKIRNYDRKYIDLFLPFNLQKFDNDTINKRKRLADNKLSQISIDFYNGVQAAIDSANALGLEVDLRVFDTRTDPGHLDSLVKKINFNQTQVAVGPIIPPNFNIVSDRLSEKDIPIIAPFSTLKKRSDNTVSSIPASSTKQKALISMLSTIHEAENLLIVTDSADYKSQYRFKYSFPNAKIIPSRKNYVQQDSILKYLNNKKENWVVMTSSDVGIVESTINHLHSLSEYEIREKNEDGEMEVVEVKHFPIRLFSSNRKNFYEDEIDNAYLSQMHFIAVDNSKQLAVEEPTEFMKAFHRKKGIYPNKYCVRGYDMLYDIVLRLAYRSDLDESLRIPGMTNYNLNRFNYQDNIFSDGYKNNAYYFIEYKDDLKTATINSLKDREKIKLDIPDLKDNEKDE